MSDLSQGTHLPVTPRPCQRQQLLSSPRVRSQNLFFLQVWTFICHPWNWTLALDKDLVLRPNSMSAPTGYSSSLNAPIMLAVSSTPSVFQSAPVFFQVPVLLDFCHFLSSSCVVLKFHPDLPSLCKEPSVWYLFLLLVRLPNFCKEK